MAQVKGIEKSIAAKKKEVGTPTFCTDRAEVNHLIHLIWPWKRLSCSNNHQL